MKPYGPDLDWRLRAFKESKIRVLLKARIAAYGGEQRAVKWLGRSYAPDVLALFPTDSLGAKLVSKSWHGWNAFVETKRPGKNATEAQAREHARMRDAGCGVVVITNEQELDAWLPPL